MRFNYTYRITYGSGQYCDRSRQQLTIEITREQYGRIIEKVIQGCTINEVPGIEEVVKDMEEQVRFVDRWDNLDGSHRKTPLKKERDIAKIELLLPEDEIRRISKMKNPVELLTKPSEQITLQRSDGSYVILSTEQGRVKLEDSRKNGMTMLMDTDQFLNLVVRW